MSATAPFGFIPFLPLLEELPTPASAGVLEAVGRVAPIVVPSSFAVEALPLLPPFAEVWIQQDGPLEVDEAIKLLDGGCRRLVSSDKSWIGQIPAARLVLQLGSADVAALEDKATVDGISGVLLETSTFTEPLLRSFGDLLKKRQGRPGDLFVLSKDRADKQAVARLPAGLKLVKKTVQSTAVVPLSNFTLDKGNFISPQATGGKLSIPSLFASTLRSDRIDGLFPTSPVSMASVPSLLGLVYSSGESIGESIVTGDAVYYSRSRNGLWRKGETSGAMQRVQRIRMDCDADALEFLVTESGPQGEKEGFCHVPGQTGCFGAASGLAELERTLKDRKASAPEGSYSARLFSEPKLLQAKLMEEAGELAEAETKEDVAAEAADLLYFALAKCVSAGVGLREVEAVLSQRSLKITRRKGDAKKEWVDKLGLSKDQAVGVAAGPSGVAAAATELEKTTAPLAAAEEGTAPDPEELKCQVYDLAQVDAKTRAKLLKRPLLESADIMGRVKPIIDTVRTGGDAGLRSLVAQFDRCTPASQPDFEVTLKAPFSKESMVLDPEVKAAIDQAYSNIKAFHQAQMDKESGTLVVETMPGVVCSRFARPIEKVGIYVPGGTAILPSTALMLAVPAQVAKCSLKVLATPPRPDGTISPEIMYIASLTEVDYVVRAGGAQAVAAMAYGTETVQKVDKIFGPGNQYVTAAKMAVSMDSGASTAIDMPAGPSEVLVIADHTSNPAFVASDLLSQAEHGPDSQVVLLAVALSDEHIASIESEIKSQALALPRVEICKLSIAHSLLIKCSSVDEAWDFSNAYAPEHLILHLEGASGMLDRVKHAGSVFVGPYSPESCGDYASGTNHTLPTYGYARQYSGVSTLSFLKHITSQELSPDGLRALGPVVEVLARAEKLNAHERAVTVRLKELAKGKGKA